MATFKPIDDKAFKRATARGRAEAVRAPKVVSVRVTGGGRYIALRLDTEMELRFPVSRVPGLHSATAEELRSADLEAGGYILRFPRIDVDISVPNLIELFMGSRSWAQRAARRKASQENGRKGGRPPKVSHSSRTEHLDRSAARLVTTTVDRVIPEALGERSLLVADDNWASVFLYRGDVSQGAAGPITVLGSDNTVVNLEARRSSQRAPA